MTVKNTSSSVNGEAERKPLTAPRQRRAEGSASAADDLVAARRDLAQLRNQVVELDARITAIRREAAAETLARPFPDTDWSRLATSLAMTFLVSTVMRRLRLGLLGAAVAPILAARLNHRLRLMW
ncbi:MAG: hypothetical protein ACK4N1_12875 [Pseudorhizobium sp.]